MALSAFKSTTKRATTPSSSSSSTASSSSSSKQEKIPNRRSRSVSAVSRTHGSLPSPPSSSNLSTSDELLLNKRDNPLYCCSSSSSSLPSPGSETPANSSKDGIRSRGRSVSRSSGVGIQSSGSRRNEKVARSLSRVDSGRRRLRSVSREHCGNLESDIEHPYKSTSSLRSKEDNRSTTSMGQRKTSGSLTTTEFDGQDRTRNLQTWTSRHPISESWDASSSCFQARNWEDGISTSSFSEAEEAAVLETFLRDNSPADVGTGEIYETVRSEVRRAVSEIRDDLENAIWRKKPAILTTENIVDIQPEFVNTDELVSDVTRECISKLKQTQERARKLRADLAVEEQREQELNRILNEMIIHAPRNSDSQKSHPKRKASIERRRMSRCLAEEAMNYFDECVSISTFDSSDFSSLEDPQPSAVIGIPSTGSSRFSPNEGSTYSVANFPSGHANHRELDNQTQCSLSIAGSDLAIGSSCSSSKAVNGDHDDLLDYETPRSGNLQRSFKMAADGAHDIRQYIKKFEKGLKREGMEHVSVKSSYSPENYDLSAKAESLVSDCLILRNRMERGGLCLCDIRVLS